MDLKLYIQIITLMSLALFMALASVYFYQYVVVVDSKVAAKFVRSCLDEQRRLAGLARDTLQCNVVLFTLDETDFLNAEVKMVNNIRVLYNKNKNIYGVLSIASQNTFNTVNTYLQYTSNMTTVTSDLVRVTLTYRVILMKKN